MLVLEARPVLQADGCYAMENVSNAPFYNEHKRNPEKCIGIVSKETSIDQTLWYGSSKGVRSRSGTGSVWVLDSVWVSCASSSAYL